MGWEEERRKRGVVEEKEPQAVQDAAIGIERERNGWRERNRREGFIDDK